MARYMWRQMPLLNLFFGTNHNRALNYVAQLPYVSRPVVPFEHAARGFAQTRPRMAVNHAQRRQKMFGEMDPEDTE